MVVVKDHQQREPSMGDITTVGLDLAKNVFQVHAVDEAGNVVVRKRLRRSQVLAFFATIPSCLVGLEACATAHHWARELIALGHQARLMPPNYVKAYVKRNKHDVADAEAICEAVRRPSMRFVPLKTAEQQSALMMHRARDLLIRQRTMLVNALRGHLAEFGLIEAQGLHKVARLITIVMDEMDERVPDMARQVLKVIVSQIKDIQTGIAELETQVLAWHKNNPVSQRLITIPGIGPIIATAIAATVADPEHIPQWQRVCRLARSTTSLTDLTKFVANEGTVISAACLSTAHTRCCFARRRPRSRRNAATCQVPCGRSKTWRPWSSLQSVRMGRDVSFWPVASDIAACANVGFRGKAAVTQPSCDVAV
jgi:transposase